MYSTGEPWPDATSPRKIPEYSIEGFITHRGPSPLLAEHREGEIKESDFE
jgi:hypothetical protein